MVTPTLTRLWGFLTIEFYSLKYANILSVIYNFILKLYDLHNMRHAGGTTFQFFFSSDICLSSFAYLIAYFTIVSKGW